MAFTSVAEEAGLARFLRGGHGWAGRATLPPDQGPPHREGDQSLKTELSMVLGDGTFPDSEIKERILSEYALS